jgi:tRNA(Ile)-lysidine synthase
MRSLVDRVRRTIFIHRLVEPGRRVVAAVSGGSDSVAMVHVLKSLDTEGVLDLVGLAHLNHRLRVGADADERFCRNLARGLDLPIDVESADVTALAAERGVSIEVAGREARYAFLVRAADRAGADRIAVGHTLDDQAETFLLRIVRGAGSRGLGAIRPRSGRVIRPLIDLRRTDLRDGLEACGLTYCEDPSNRDLDYPRNRLRHEVLPYLARHFTPDVAVVMAREAAIARDEADWLDAGATDVESRIVWSEGDILVLDLRGLLALHPALARRVAQRALIRGAGGRFIGFDHVEAALALARNGTGAAGIDLPGQRAELAGPSLRLRPLRGRTGRGARRPTAEPLAPVPLAVPGRVELPDIGWAISAEPWASDGVKDLERVPPGVVAAFVSVDTSEQDRARVPLAVRTRRPGDRVRLPGGGGRKKLQDLFVDRKVPREERDRVPLVVDAQGRIAWVVGHAVAGDFRVTTSTRAVILLKASRLGGPG